MLRPMAGHQSRRSVSSPRGGKRSASAPEREAAPAPRDAVSPWVRLRSGGQHPFVYQRMIDSADAAARPGDVVQVYDRSGRLVGRGLFNPRSQIAVRMLAWGETAIDESFWRARLSQALALRRALRLDEATDAGRLVHAEGDGLSGLVVERFADTLVFEVFSLGMFQRVGLLAPILCELLGAPGSLDRPGRAAPAWRVVVRADAGVEAIEGFRAGPTQDAAALPLVIREHGVRYRVDPSGGHKTGFFCDQRDNRLALARLCQDASVLDLCCYSGGFGLCAKLLGKARDATSVDLDEAALALARENANLNQARIEHVHADAFGYLRQMAANGRSYDAVVLDPPKFAPTRDSLDEALHKYHDLNALGMRVVRPGGVLLTCSCSGLVSPGAFVELLHSAARRVGRGAQLFNLTGAAGDHPVMLNCPESAYLKAAWLRVP